MLVTVVLFAKMSSGQECQIVQIFSAWLQTILGQLVCIQRNLCVSAWLNIELCTVSGHEMPHRRCSMKYEDFEPDGHGHDAGSNANNNGSDSDDEPSTPGNQPGASIEEINAESQLPSL
jgi:hypothetical protein